MLGWRTETKKLVLLKFKELRAYDVVLLPPHFILSFPVQRVSDFTSRKKKFLLPFAF